MKRLQNITIRIIITLLGILPFYSCIDEDGPNGDEAVKFKFKYTDVARNKPIGIVAKDVKRLHLYVFDKNNNNKFVVEHAIDVNNFDENTTIGVPLEFGVYNVVIWGGDTRNDYEITPSLMSGTTTLADAVLKLKRNTTNGIVDNIPHNLFFASMNSITVATCEELFTTDMFQHTNSINIELQGMNLSEPVSVTVIDNNGKESFGGAILDDDSIRYTRKFTNTAVDTLHTTLRVMQLEEGRSAKMVIERDNATGSDRLLFEGDLIKILLALKDAGAPIVDFKTRHEYDLAITFDNLKDVTISMGPWKVIVDRVSL